MTKLLTEYRSRYEPIDGGIYYVGITPEEWQRLGVARQLADVSALESDNTKFEAEVLALNVGDGVSLD